MNEWSNFFFAEVGASATLAGLIFVGVSINLKRILSFPTLPNRALEALLILLTVLLVSSLLLVPNQSQGMIGTEVLCIGLAAWLTTTFLDMNIWKNIEAKYRKTSTLVILMNQVTLIPYIIAGIVLLLNGFSGLYWLVAATLLSIIKALLDAWILLVEINR